MVSFPFVENGNIRTFDQNVSQEELQWHWDEQDRKIKAIHETDWKIQLDNELPKPLTEIFIPSGAWHRLIKGTGTLSVMVDKL